MRTSPLSYCRPRTKSAGAGWAIGLYICGAAAGFCAAAPPSAPRDRSPECTVWAREQAFAKAVVDRNASAFAELIAKDAIFDVGTAKPVRGPDAIANQWRDILAGKGIRPRWYPTRVVLSGDGALAWSTGPVLIENPGATASERYQLGKFRSVWRKEADGAWRVLFDDGGSPIVVTDKEVATFNKGMRDCAPAK